jgi:hypothetical protein
MLVHGGTNVSAASLARRGGCASGFMGVKLICIKVLLGVYTHMPPVA